MRWRQGNFVFDRERRLFGVTKCRRQALIPTACAWPVRSIVAEGTRAGRRRFGPLPRGIWDAARRWRGSQRTGSEGVRNFGLRSRALMSEGLGNATELSDGHAERKDDKTADNRGGTGAD